MSISVPACSEHGLSHKFSKTDPRLYKNILCIGLTKSYQHRQDIFFEGDAKKTVYLIESGAVCLYKMTLDGRRQIFDFASQGDLIGLGSGVRHSHSAQAIGVTSLKSIPFSTLHERAARDPSVALKLYQAMSAELEATRDLLLSLAQLEVLERVVAFLVALSHRRARAGRDPLSLKLLMTESDIADLLGMRIETVSRALTKLRQRRLIEAANSSMIKIMNLKGHEALVTRGYEH